MNDEKNQPETDLALEARVVALLLGEASEFEREQLMELIAQRADLAALKAQLGTVHGLLCDVASEDSVAEDAQWKLSPEKRNAVLELLNAENQEVTATQVTVRPNGERRIWKKRYWLSLASVAIVIISVGLVLNMSTQLQLAKSERMLGGTRRQLGLAREALNADNQEATLRFFGEVPAPRAERRFDSDFGRDEYRSDTAGTTRGTRLDDSAPESDSRASLLAIGESLKTAEGMQLPTPYYLQDDVQYFETKPSLAPRADSLALDGTQAMDDLSAEPSSEPNVPAIRLQSVDGNAVMQGLSERIDSGPNLAFSANVDRYGVAEGTARTTAELPAVAGKSDSLFSGFEAELESANPRKSDAKLSDLSRADVPTSHATAGLASGEPDIAAIALGTELDVDLLGEVPELPRADLNLPTVDLPVAPANSADIDADGLTWDESKRLRGDASLGGTPAAPQTPKSGLANENAYAGSLSEDYGAFQANDSIRALERSTADGEIRGQGIDEWARPALDKESGAVSTPTPEPSAEFLGWNAGSAPGKPTSPGAFYYYGTGAEADLEELQSKYFVPYELQDAPSGEESSRFGEDVWLKRKYEGRYAWGALPQTGQVANHYRTIVPSLSAGEVKGLGVSPAEKMVTPAGLEESLAAVQASSTFSLHVSDVSFKLAAAALSKGEWPEASSIRIEEFVNAFSYGDPLPSEGERVACRVEQASHPFLQQRNLMRVAMRTAAAGRSSNTPLRLTLLLDNSGSMERMDRQETVRRAFALLANQLTSIDEVTLISFARQPRLLADRVNGEKSKQLVELIDGLPSEGGTNIEAALQLAFEKALEQQVSTAQNRIVLLTDGAVNLGDADPQRLSQMITTMRDAGIAFDAAGISAEGLNDEILEALTRQGDGRYYLLDSADAADDGFARQIAGALRPSAKNVKVQVEFNPKRVGRYKLLGFEKHLLNKEDFRDDQVDAAEMAAEEAGVAVYQVEAKPDGEGDVGSVSVRFRDLSTGQMVENRWPIPYESNAPRPDQAAPTMRIASVAALFAAKLQGDALGASVELKTLAELLASLPETERSAKRVQQLQTMIAQARQLTGK